MHAIFPFTSLLPSYLLAALSAHGILRASMLPNNFTQTRVSPRLTTDIPTSTYCTTKPTLTLSACTSRKSPEI
ncbi:hypothetical protein BGZ60DRAFT_399894 [Tricladium varicosporioides]|nr:hypothetical protein BGZ60DRAFT_399894 [Hymenoscyphus varicosporioides]